MDSALANANAAGVENTLGELRIEDGNGDLAEVGNSTARFASCFAATGGHPFLLVGTGALADD